MRSYLCHRWYFARGSRAVVPSIIRIVSASWPDTWNPQTGTLWNITSPLYSSWKLNKPRHRKASAGKVASETSSLPQSCFPQSCTAWKNKKTHFTWPARTGKSNLQTNCFVPNLSTEGINVHLCLCCACCSRLLHAQAPQMHWHALNWMTKYVSTWGSKIMQNLIFAPQIFL